MKTYYSISNHPKYFEMHTEFRNQFSSPHFLFLHANTLLSFYIQSILVWLYSANNSVPHFLMLDKVVRTCHTFSTINIRIYASQRGRKPFLLLASWHFTWQIIWKICFGRFWFFLSSLPFFLFSHNLYYIIFFKRKTFFALYVECIQIGQKVVRNLEKTEN